MATIVLTDPTAGNVITAGLHVNNNSALRTAINGGLDNNNVAAGAGIEFSKFTWHLGSAPPGSPSDGMVWIYNGTAGIFWMFVYDSTEATYKWKFIGGGPLSNEITTTEATASVTFVDLTTPGPSLTIPRAGDYEIGAGVYTISAAVAGSGGVLGLKNAGGATADYATGGYGSGTAEQRADAIARTTRITVASASDVVKLQYRAFNANSTSFANRWLFVRPVRVI